MASTTSTTDLIAASRSLDPAGRALLNLWLHRGLDDAAIAGLAGGSAADVAGRRRQVVERLAAEVGDTPDAIRAALDDLAFGPARAPAPAPAAPPEGLVLPGAPAPGAAPEDLVVAGHDVPAAAPVDVAVSHPDEPASEPADLVVLRENEPGSAPADPVAPGAAQPAAALVVPGEMVPAAVPEIVVPPEAERPRPEPAAAPAAQPSPPRAVARRSPIPATLGVALGLVIGVTVLAAGLGGGGEGGGGEEPRPTPGAEPTAAAPRPQPLEALPGGPDRVTGTMTVQGGAVRLDVDGVDRPRGDYTVWLYNSLADARPLGRLTDASLRLPPQARDFAFLDVSLEGDRNPNHSGRSVLRARLPR